MFQCPSCHTTFKTAAFSGWILQVVGNVTVDDRGQVVAAGPMRAISTIKQGHELDAYRGRMRCPSCNLSAAPSKFPVVRVCRFTQKIANVAIQTKFGELWISAEDSDAIRQMLVDTWQYAVTQEGIQGNV